MIKESCISEYLASLFELFLSFLLTKQNSAVIFLMLKK